MTALGASLYVLSASSEARMTQDAPSVICELFPGVTLPHGRSKAGLSLASVSMGLSGPPPFVVVKPRPVAREGGFALAGKIVFLLCRREPLLAFRGVLVGLP